MELIEAVRQALPEGARAREINPSVINIYGEGREATQADLSAALAAITGAGYIPAESWVATEGMSWLSDGVRSVSIRIERT
jgi:hypothetical protein